MESYILCSGHLPALVNDNSKRLAYFPDSKTSFYKMDAFNPNITKDTDLQYESDNIYKNGDFEDFLKGENNSSFIEKTQKNGITVYKKNNFFIPSNWGISLGKVNQINTPLIILDNRNPLSGKYSLLVSDSFGKYPAEFYTTSIQKDKINYSINVKNLYSTSAFLKIEYRYYDKELNRNFTIRKTEYIIPSGETFLIHDHIDNSDYPESITKIYLHFSVKGTMLFDNFVVTYCNND